MENNKITICSIGDTHGRTNWRKLLDLNDLVESNEHDNILPIYDKYIFLGDYVDSFNVMDVEIKKNLLDIISLKKKYPNHIILLLGNHDIQYLFGYNKYGCSGFRPQMEWDLKDIFKKNLDLFQLSYQIHDTIWSHAGITEWWYKNRYLLFFDSKKNKQFDIVQSKKLSMLSHNINKLFEYEVDILFDVGHLRGGYQVTGGPLWADKRMLQDNPLTGINQIVGHTVGKDLDVHITEDEKKLVFCDCMEHKNTCYLSQRNV